MKFNKWFNKQKRKKDINPRNIKKEQSVDDLDKEVQEKLSKITKEDIINQTIEHAKKLGRQFDNEEKARQWAQRYLDNEIMKERIKKGVSISCNICKKAGSNKTTGPLIRDPNGGYKHQNC